jgi:hypothetical protein
LPPLAPAVILGRLSDVTHILSAIEQGDPHAAEQLLPLVYDELHQLAAREKPLPRGSTGYIRPCPPAGSAGTAA